MRTLLIRIAYGLHETQVAGGPDWIASERFDIEGKAPGFATAAGFRDQARLMLRPMLADRFKLVLRHESRERAVYALVSARADGSFGPPFRRSLRATGSGDADPIATARAMALSNLVVVDAVARPEPD